MKVITVPINSIKLWKDNPRVNDKASKELAKLIKLYGQRSPINVWDKNKVVYKGNTTLKAMKLLGMKTIDVIFHHFKSETEAIAYALSDNKASDWSDWDDNILLKMMKNKDYHFTSSNTGFSEKELKAFTLGTDGLPGKLEDLGIKGKYGDKADFMIVQFDSKEQMGKFIEELGVKLTQSRAVPFKDLLSWRKGNGERIVQSNTKSNLGNTGRSKTSRKFSNR